MVVLVAKQRRQKANTLYRTVVYMSPLIDWLLCDCHNRNSEIPTSHFQPQFQEIHREFAAKY